MIPNLMLETHWEVAPGELKASHYNTPLVFSNWCAGLQAVAM
jgi:hypothetical protein